MKALILIGGEGTRLRPLTLNTLKCMVPIAGKHFFRYQFDLLRDNGIKDVVLSICHMPGRIKTLLGTGKKYGVNIKYAVEKNPLGTGGAIKNAERFLDDTTVVMNGDILTDLDIKKMIAAYKKSKASAAIALHEVDDPTSYGLVETDKKNRILRFLEKPKWAEVKDNRWINAGIYIFDKKVLGYIPRGENYSLERRVFPELLKCGEIMTAYKTNFYWLDIGRVDKYKQANFDILEGRLKKYAASCGKNTGGAGCRISKKAFLKGPYFIGSKTVIAEAAVNPLSIIGSGCIIGKNSSVERSIIWDDVKIGENCVIRDCVLGKGCEIRGNSVVTGLIIGDNSKITEYSRSGE
ncbi:MAG TPA: NDP-sugar synthase [Firmicutes bacterium]|nr:NDP-sugar synthase [Bacillota bacterium]